MEAAMDPTLMRQMMAGRTSCGNVTEAQLEQLGDFVMEQMIGNHTLHEAMEDRMGVEWTRAAHIMMGAQVSGCVTFQGMPMMWWSRAPDPWGLGSSVNLSIMLSVAAIGISGVALAASFSRGRRR